jgi:hypothetical protein
MAPASSSIAAPTRKCEYCAKACKRAARAASINGSVIVHHRDTEAQRKTKAKAKAKFECTEVAEDTER